MRCVKVTRQKQLHVQVIAGWHVGHEHHDLRPCDLGMPGRFLAETCLESHPLRGHDKALILIWLIGCKCSQ